MEQNLTDTDTMGINFELCLDAQMTDCLGWASDRDSTMIEERHGPAEVPSGYMWPDLSSMDLSNIARWVFSNSDLDGHQAAPMLTYDMHLDESNPST